MVRKFFLFAVALLLASPAAARFKSFGEALSLCLSDLERDQRECYGYLQGLYDAADLLTVEQLREPLFCLPKGASGEQMRLAFVRYGDEARVSMFGQGAASAAFYDAMSAAFPCPKRPK